jgi:hypothetical protein
MDSNENQTIIKNKDENETESVKSSEKSILNHPSNENRNSSLRKLVKSVLVDCITNTTVVGPPNIIKENLHFGMKVMWFICFLGFSSYCIVNVVQTFQDYLKYPTVVSTAYVHEIPTQFPAVSFCNMKSPDRSSIYTQEFFAYLSAINYSLDPTSNFFFNLLDWIISKKYLWIQLIDSFSHNSSFIESLGYQIEDMLVSCEFNYLPCNSSDFSYFYHPQYGNCYTFNKNMPAKTVSVPGVLYGLQLELYLGNPPVDTVNNDKDGILMSIHNQTDAPFTRMDVIEVAAGAETDFILNRNFITRIPPPYGSCMKTGFTSTLYEYIVNTLNVSYSQEYCFSLCMQNETKAVTALMFYYPCL